MCLTCKRQVFPRCHSLGPYRSGKEGKTWTKRGGRKRGGKRDGQEKGRAVAVNGKIGREGRRGEESKGRQEDGVSREQRGGGWRRETRRGEEVEARLSPPPPQNEIFRGDES